MMKASFYNKNFFWNLSSIPVPSSSRRKLPALPDKASLLRHNFLAGLGATNISGFAA